jgi:EAL domain-containing protein (putative c-di-GMP-specific phosphodiesterase class I)
MQGYLFSPPVPAARFDELLESSKTLALPRQRVTR